jgi:hypothetical protein
MVWQNSQNPETLSHWQSLAGFKDVKKGIKVSEGDVLKETISDPIIPRTEELVNDIQDSSPQNQQNNGRFPNNSNVVDDDIQTQDYMAICTWTTPPESTIVKQTWTRVIKHPEHLIEVAYFILWGASQGRL